MAHKSQAELFAERFHTPGWPVKTLPKHDDGISIPEPHFRPTDPFRGFKTGLVLHILQTSNIWTM